MKYLITSLFICFSLIKAQALTLNANSGHVAAKPIAVVPFAGDYGNTDQADFIISSDLKQTGIFSPISPASYIERPSDTSNLDYSQFSKLGVSYVIIGKKNLADNKIVLRFAIADTLQEKVIGSYTVTAPANNPRLAAHKASDIILNRLTGVRGAFATRIAYVYDSGLHSTYRYQLIISDSDGKNPTTLLKSPAPLMSPRFSPDGKKIAYVTFEGNNSQIVIQDIQTGKRELVNKSQGINSSPAWSPDGTKIAMVLSKDGNPEVYFKDLTSQQLIRVTNNPSIDTEPAWASNGQEIYFTSDRSRVPQLYSIDIRTGTLKKISNTGKYSAGAAISPKGDKIALSRNVNGKYIIGTIDLKTGVFSKVSTGFSDETPRFSPNGQMLIFSSAKNNKQVLVISNVDGSGENVLSATGNIGDSDWSTYIN